VFLRWLAGQDPYGPEALRESLARELHRPPTTCNAHLAAVTNLCLWLGLDTSQEKATTLSKTAQRALSEPQVRRLLRTAERRGNVRDQAILVLLLATGLRLSELTALDLDDVALAVRKGSVTVRNDKGGKYRVVPLNSQARETLQA